ncbi:MAG: alanine:cation symporter family protein [Eubacterium sp.]
MLAIKYREVNQKGEMSGGPMYTMKKGFKHKNWEQLLVCYLQFLPLLHPLALEI